MSDRPRTDLAQTSLTMPPQVQRPERINIKRCGLEVVEGPDAGQRLDPLAVTTIIGRHPWCDMVLSDPRVSGEHCEITVTQDVIRFRDLGSSNGSIFGGLRVVELFLEPGATIRLGDTAIRIVEQQGMRSLQRFHTDPSGSLIGTGTSMQRLFDMMRRVASRDLPVLLLGETGTGKTAVARAMHDISDRSRQPFVSINCGALPPDLVESTLFGHVKGAFTGAHRAAQGLFEQAGGGSVLLDEIGEMPLNLQPKLLQVLETQRVRPVGSDREIEVEFRLFTATNRRLRDEVGAGRFRQDLYYRVAGIALTLPPLRERPEDLAHLARMFLARHSGAADEELRAGLESELLGSEVLRKLTAHTWPGNVRELENVIYRSVALADGPDLTPDHIVLSSAMHDAPFERGPDGGYVPREGSTALEETPAPGGDLLDQPFKEFKASLLARNEQAYFERLMDRVEGNISKAAREAGISRTYLLTMIRKYGLYDGPG